MAFESHNNTDNFSLFFPSLKLPIADYRTDTKSVLDQCLRVLQAMVDVAADASMLATTLSTIHLAQMVVQARWHSDSSLLQLPNVTEDHVQQFAAQRPAVLCLPQLLELAHASPEQAAKVLEPVMGAQGRVGCMAALHALPVVGVRTEVVGVGGDEPLVADSEYSLKVRKDGVDEANVQDGF